MNDNTILSLSFPGRQGRASKSVFNLLVETVKEEIAMSDPLDRIRDIDGYLRVWGMEGTPLNTIPAPVGMLFKGRVVLGRGFFSDLRRVHPSMELQNSFLLPKNMSTFRKSFMGMLTRAVNQSSLGVMEITQITDPVFWIEEESLPEGFFIREDIEDFEVIEDFEIKFTGVRLDIKNRQELVLDYVLRVNWDNLVLDSEPQD